MPRVLQPCGTRAAYRRHRAHGEVTCAACCAAVAEYNRQYRPEPTVRGRYGRARCGSTAGYKRHIRRGEETCKACRAAEAKWKRERRAAQTLDVDVLGVPIGVR